MNDYIKGILRRSSTLLISLFFFTVVSAQDLLIFGGKGHDDFLGCLSCSGYSSDSICNGYGKYGNKYNPSGMWNPYGGFGNKYSSKSPWNKYSNSNSVPVVVDRDGNFYGYFTINQYRSKAFKHARVLREIFEEADGDLEVVRKSFCELLH
jgi:hypothetical protein|tara:strand:- start:10 stop:462 length:453 start_codon:yes stop_codon:yes gene_type:complete